MPEVDYQALMSQLPPQSRPRRKLKELQENGYLIRLKKGFYILTPEVSGKDYSLQIAANLLYGPSYLSLEYALSYYQLIPERVEAITSVTTQKNKIFQTPAGRFTYEHLASKIYPVGIHLGKTIDGRLFLIATPEKALMDIFSLRFEKSKGPTSKDIYLALRDDLRFNVSAFIKQRNEALLLEMKVFYRNRPWHRVLIEELLAAK